MAEMICDGIHIHPAVIRATFKMFGPERIVLISDSMMATGMENGTYQLGGQEVTMKDCKATLKDGTIAGSATNLYDCLLYTSRGWWIFTVTVHLDMIFLMLIRKDLRLF